MRVCAGLLYLLYYLAYYIVQANLYSKLQTSVIQSTDYPELTVLFEFELNYWITDLSRGTTLTQ